jgi:methylase of polypeptide subunit release factors
MAVFTPNLTSKLLLKVGVAEMENTAGSILEVGCGSGWITQELIRSNGTAHNEYYLSDISTEAIEIATKNLDGLVDPANIRVGGTFDPWPSMKFDIIINDVAGISDPIAQASDWYIDVPFRAGIDGLDNTRNMLSEIRNFLRPGGVFIAPIISLSDVTEYRKLLDETFGSVTVRHHTLWPMPDEILRNEALIEDLRRRKLITLEEKYSRFLAFTEICVAKGPKGS